MHSFFEWLVIGVDAEAYDLHEYAWHGFAPEHGHDGRFEGVPFHLWIIALKLLGNFFLRW